jgi:rSAM/selenodomain-associated transferase 1
MKYPQACIALFARVPVEGQVKTRLIPSLGAAGACRVHEQLLQRALGVVLQQTLCAAELWLDAPGKHPLLDDCTLPLRLQQGGDIGARMAHAMASLLERYAQVLIIGSDVPGLDADYLDQALAALAAGNDLVLGPACDGGYVLIGMAAPHAFLFEGIAWSTPQVLQQTLDLAAKAGLGRHLLQALPDVDRPEDLRFVL